MSKAPDNSELLDAKKDLEDKLYILMSMFEFKYNVRIGGVRVLRVSETLEVETILTVQVDLK